MSHYIHGSAPEEQARLSTLNELINDRCLNVLNIRKGETILDVGSGLGQFTIRMAEAAGGTSKCLGIERDERQLTVALQRLQATRQRSVEFRKGNVENLELQPGEWGSFDLAHARFILEHVQQPEDVVRGMVNAVRPGGRVVVADDDHEHLCLYPNPPGFSIVWQAYMRSYDRLGNDPLIGRKIVSLLYKHGLRNIHNNVVFFGDSGESPTFSSYVTNLIGILEGAKDLMIHHHLLDQRIFEDAMNNLQTWSHQSDASLWYTISWAEGIKS